jgi:uncharacterized lipoprotein YmbA
MKKICIILTVCMLMVLVLGSCGANKKCPAYSLRNSEKTTSVRS